MHVSGFKYREIAERLGLPPRNGKKPHLLYKTETAGRIEGLHLECLSGFCPASWSSWGCFSEEHSGLCDG